MQDDNHDRFSVRYPKSVCDPRELLNFIHGKPYTEGFEHLGLTDDEQRQIETAIMLNPIVCQVIEGTGGVRRLDMATPTNSRGALQYTVFYAYYPEVGIAVLISIHDTDDLDELSRQECAELKVEYELLQLQLGS